MLEAFSWISEGAQEYQFPMITMMGRMLKERMHLRKAKIKERVRRLAARSVRERLEKRSKLRSKQDLRRSRRRNKRSSKLNERRRKRICLKSELTLTCYLASYRRR